MQENTPIKQICDAVEAAHAKIQQDFAHINPVVGLNQRMRDIGIPTDIMTIDCLNTGKRILLVLHDAKPDMVDYQFCLRDKDPHDTFERIPLADLTTAQLYTWMQETFSIPN